MSPKFTLLKPLTALLAAGIKIRKKCYTTAAKEPAAWSIANCSSPLSWATWVLPMGAWLENPALSCSQLLSAQVVTWPYAPSSIRARASSAVWRSVEIGPMCRDVSSRIWPALEYYESNTTNDVGPDLASSQVDLVISSHQCQPFSGCNPGAGGWLDPRSQCMLPGAECTERIRELNPGLQTFDENVLPAPYLQRSPHDIQADWARMFLWPVSTLPS